MVICGTLMHFFCNFSVDTETNINPLISNLLILDLFTSMQQHKAIKKTDLSKPSHPQYVWHYKLQSGNAFGKKWLYKNIALLNRQLKMKDDRV